MNNKLVLLGILFVVAVSSNARPCMVMPSESLHKATLTEVDEFVIFHKQREELLVQARVKLPEKPGAVDRIGFIIPVPGTPDSAVLEGPSLLRDIRTFMRQSAYGLPAPPEVVGEEQPSIISSRDGEPVSEALNRWLARNGLQTVRLERLRPYDEEEWSFVIQRAYTSGYSGDVLLRPVRISFGTTEIVFPLRLMTGEGPLACRLFLMTHDNLNTEPLEEFGFAMGKKAAPVRLVQLPESIELLVGRAAGRFSVFKELRRGNIYLFSAAAQVHGARWNCEVTLAKPHVPLLSAVQNILAVAAAVAAVLLMNRPKKKADGENNGGSA